MLRSTDTVVIVGASLAGLRTAEVLRERGHEGPIRLIGGEEHLPYDRPPLSKQVLAGTWEASDVGLQPAAADLGLDLILGSWATGLDVGARRVATTSGDVGYDALVIATGAVPRTLPTDPGLGGVFVLRTLDDSLALRGAFEAAPARVVVIGAGFIGAEVAATARGRGLEVTILEALPVPLHRGLGEVGRYLADVHRDHGVDIRLGTGVDGIVGTDHVEGVRLTDGTVVEADVVVVGIGVRPATDWLEGSGLRLEDGVVCDDTLVAAPGVVAAGDIARWPNRRYGVTMRLEHWENASEQGRAAGIRLVSDDPGAPFEPIPWFWSDQYDRKIQLAGWPGADAEIAIVEDDPETGRLVVVYGRDGKLVGVLGINRPRQVMRFRMAMVDDGSWDDALAMAKEA